MRIVLRFNQPGDVPEIWTDAPDIEVLTISEFVPEDRVYKLGPAIARVTPDELDKLIGASRVGRLGDMPGAEAKVRRLLNGEPEPVRGSHLSVVQNDPGDAA